MAFTLLSTTFCPREEETVIQSGSAGGFSFQVRFFAFGIDEFQPIADILNFWDTGNVDVGRVTLRVVNVLTDRTSIITTAVPEGTQGLSIWVRKKAPVDGYSVALYRRL